MAPFRAKIGGKSIKEGENKNYRFIPFLSGAEQNANKKQKKLKNTIMASFQANIVWKMPGNREIKNYRFVPFLTGAVQKMPKKNAKKLKKYHYGIISSQNSFQKANKGSK